MSEQRKELMYDRNRLPSRYWEIGWEDANEFPQEESSTTYDEEELPFE